MTLKNMPLEKATNEGWCKAKEFGCECGRDEFEPCPLPHPKDRRVVCAAIRNPEGAIICGARHWDDVMRNQVRMTNGHWGTAEQGFIDQRGEFLTREQALMVATRAGQIVRRCGGDTRELFSENLY